MSESAAPMDGAPEPVAQPAGQIGRGIAAAAIVIMLGNVLSRVLGLGREQLASGLFGTGDQIAAFTVADNVNTLIFDLMVSGMLEAALIPVLAQWAAPDRGTRDELRRIAGALLTLVCVAVGAVMVIGVLFAPAVVHVMTATAGQSSDHGAGTVALTVTLVRLILPSVLLLSVGTVLMATLYAIGSVTAPALAPAARNGAIVLMMVLLAGPIGVKSLAIGVVAGAALIVGLQLVPLWRAGAMPRPNFGFRQPAVRTVLSLYFPIALGLIVSSLAVVIDRNLAWRASTDALGAMRYATTLVQMLLGLVAAAISLAALPTLSRHHAAGDEAAFCHTLGRALAMVTVLIVPATFGLAAISVPAVDLLFRHGATNQTGAHAIVVALLGYLPGTLFAAYDQVLIFAFYARKNTRLPVIVGVFSVGVYFIVAISLVHPLGMLGLVLANSAQFISHAIVMFLLARRQFGHVGGRLLLAKITKTAAAATVMALLAFALWRGLDMGLPVAASVSGRVGRELLLVALPAGIAGGCYLAALHLMRVEELVTLRRTLLGRFIPRFAG